MLVLPVLLAARTLSAQEARVVGQVTDASSGAPIGEVQVYLNGTGLGSLTRQNGRFIILNVLPGSYEARAERIGYQGVAQQITVAAARRSR
jgi:hypothetical protein